MQEKGSDTKEEGVNTQEKEVNMREEDPDGQGEVSDIQENRINNEEIISASIIYTSSKQVADIIFITK